MVRVKSSKTQLDAMHSSKQSDFDTDVTGITKAVPTNLFKTS